MTPPLWATVVVSVIGLGAAIAVWLGSLRPRPEAARREIEQGLSRLDMALVSGGAARGLDSDIVDLVERGIVRAARGRFTVVGEADAAIPNEIMLIKTAEEHGEGGIDALREGADTWYRLSYHRLIKRRLIVSPDRVKASPALLWAPTMLVLFLCTLWMMFEFPDPGPGLPPWGPAAISIGAWAVVPLLQLMFWCLQPGYHGRDPRSRLGRDVIAEVSAAVGADPGASQADRVAVGGFAAMTDAPLRREIMGDAADSEWNAKLWRKREWRASAGEYPGGS